MSDWIKVFDNSSVVCLTEYQRRHDARRLDLCITVTFQGNNAKGKQSMDQNIRHLIRMFDTLDVGPAR